MGKEFNCSFLGQLHWYLNARIDQRANYDVTIDQSRYATGMIARFAPGYEPNKPSEPDRRKYSSPLPNEFEFTKKDCAENSFEVKRLEEEFGFRYRTLVGSMMWVTNTMPRIIFAIRKFSKFSQCPGRKHFEALRHCLHHVRCHHFTGITFYHDVLDAPVSKLLFELHVDPLSPVITFSDSSFHDDPDNGRSTGSR